MYLLIWTELVVRTTVRTENNETDREKGRERLTHTEQREREREAL